MGVMDGVVEGVVGVAELEGVDEGEGVRVDDGEGAVQQRCMIVPSTLLARPRLAIFDTQSVMLL